jgi:uncharacterized caspase-like protein
MLRLAVALLVGALLPSAALAQKRVALVIGNSAYQNTSALPNPRSDATDMGALLKKLGFQVIEGFDLDKAFFDRKVRDFAETLSGAKVGVFFYAGHGIQVAGQNYLVPIDAKLTTGAALDWEMVRLDLVQRTMERETETNILFLDACRDNPLGRNLARAMGTRSGQIGRGLAAAEAGVGTLISFSTQPGNTALDGSGRNSPFAGSLVKRIATSGDDLSAVLIDVRNDVRKETQNQQVPWEHSALTGRFYFNPSAPVASPSAPMASVPTQSAELGAALKRLEAVETELRKRAAVQPFPETSHVPSKTAAFDGVWQFTQVGDASPECLIRTPTRGSFTVRGGAITSSGETGGKVNPDGTFSFVRPNPKFKGQHIVIKGKLKDGKGTADWVSNTCLRKVTVQNLEN